MAAKGSSNSEKPQKQILLRKVSRPLSLFMTVLKARTPLGVATRLVLLTVPVWALHIVNATSTTFFASGFEAGLSGWDKQLLCCKDSVQIVSSPTREGKYAAKFTFRKSDPRVRAEIRKFDSVTANSERWYGHSIFIPKEYTKDPMPEIITQWGSRPDRELGEDGKRPPVALVTRHDKLQLVNHWDSKPATLTSKGIGIQEWDLGPIAKGEWTDWVLHAKWSYKSDGLLEVWKNGKLIVRKTGPNSYNDKIIPSMKIGIYKRQWKKKSGASTTTERVIYYDAIRIGDASASYNDVSPK